MRCYQLVVPKLLASTALASLLSVAISSPAFALVITPTFDSTITSDPNAAAVEGVINTAIGVYQATFSDPITVTIDFAAMSTGLGRSVTGFNNETYTSFLTALHTDATSSADATALAHLPIQATNPVTGSGLINATTANLRALGFNAPGFVNGTFDGQISLNTHITAPGSPGSTLAYFLLPVVEHEIDEVLGLHSDVGGTAFFTNPAAEDLFRYDSLGNRSFTTNPLALAFFSIDGLTDLAQFDNQNDGGDFGDWQSNQLPPGVQPKVQDAFATQGANPSLGVELTALDVIGYDRVAVPEPGSLALLSTGLLAFGFLRRKRARRNRREYAVDAQLSRES